MNFCCLIPAVVIKIFVTDLLSETFLDLHQYFTTFSFRIGPHPFYSLAFFKPDLYNYWSWWLISCFLDRRYSLQTFAIPGSIFLSILSGFLFPTALALSLVCTVSVIAYWFVWFTFQTQCSGIGATFCYLLSSLIGRGLVRKYIPERAEKWKEQVSCDSR